jgi:hypothetical protein
MGSLALAFMDIRIGSCHTLQLSFSLGFVTGIQIRWGRPISP